MDQKYSNMELEQLLIDNEAVFLPINEYIGLVIAKNTFMNLKDIANRQNENALIKRIEKKFNLTGVRLHSNEFYSDWCKIKITHET